jgi:hypothetical protein
MTAAVATRSQTKADPVAARRWLWRTLVLIIVGGSVGATWDRIWHATIPFDGFWSPPHVVVYVTVAVASLMGMMLLFTEKYRVAFGRSFRVSFLPFPVPGALFITGSALGLLGLAGAVFDNIWHTAFGLNETPWSFPHAMLGTSLLLLGLGFLSSRLNMADKPVPTSTTVLLGFLIVLMSMSVFTGPLTDNRTLESLEFYYTFIPTLASQESAQSVYRLFEQFNLTRSHPMLLFLAPLWLGAAFAFLRGLDKRIWVLVVIMLWVWITDYGDRDFGEQIAGFTDERNWQALPILLPTLLFALVVRWRERVAYVLAGFVFMLMIWGIWKAEQSAWVIALLSPLAVLIGRRIGQIGYDIVANPVSFRAVLPLISFTVLVPLTTGVVDLWLRSQIG